jgi:putative nucleotidyltransferase with HDIG domain
MLQGSVPVEAPISTQLKAPPNRLLTELAHRLHDTFGVPFYLFDTDGTPLFVEIDWPPPPGNWGRRLARQVGSSYNPSGDPQLLVHENPLVVLGLTLSGENHGTILAVGLFLTSRLAPSWIIRRRLLRQGFGEGAQILAERLLAQPAWPKDALLRTAGLFLAHHRLVAEKKAKEKECQALAAELAGTYEEISLLHRLTQNLRLSQTDEELASLALEWMQEAVPAEGIAILLLSPETISTAIDKRFPHREGAFFTRGNCPLDASQLLGLAAELKVEESSRPIVCNRRITQKPDWRYPDIHELIIAPLVGGKECFGYLAVFNHSQGGEFGTVEASLVGSIAAILGSHSSNLLLYRQQEESLAGIIRALTAAIDAKDAYTCGHSDRVARLAVRLAQELGVDSRMLHTIYLAGLLHDIGKIGTSEAILRKPGKLSPEEYEHIKQHVRIGYRILMDLKHLSGVLPAVLHHHERWDGGGYPAGLAGEEIPLAARIIAVADAFDAMGSNRAYRSRLPDEKIDAILREGAGKQWDPAVIEAFFRIRDELDVLVQEERSAREEQQFFLPTASTVHGAIPAAVLALT